MPPAAPSAEPTLELRNVSKFFGDHAALREVDLRVGRGESVLVFGSNGAGKTTLLRTLASLARPSEGEVFYSGRRLSSVAASCKAAIGFVSHATFLYGDLTARENLRFAGALFGLADLDRRIDAALAPFSVAERSREPVRGLSRGLQQRVALARAFLHDPEFLLLDEPFTGLDAPSVESLVALLAGLPQQGKTVVFSTHDFDQGKRVARRLVALERGRVRYDGPIEGARPDARGAAIRAERVPHA